MNPPSANPLYRQVTRAARRLFLQVLLKHLACCWAAALALSAGWLLLEPYVLSAPPDWLPWSVVAGTLGIATGVALALAVWQAPSRLAAALLLDERFGLRERVTTALTLDARDAATPAGQALLDDVAGRVAPLDVAGRFPLRPTAHALLVPAGAALLAAVAILYDPIKSEQMAGAEEDRALPEAERLQAEQTIEALQKKRREARPAEQPRSQKLEQLDDEFDRIASRPHGTRDDARERLKELTDLEEQLQKEQQDLADKDQAVRDQLEQPERLAKKKQEGPANDLDKALGEGDFHKAKEEAERLSKKLKDDQLDAKEQADLKEQLHDLQDRLDRLSRRTEEKERLEDMAKKGDIDKETLDRELDRLSEEQMKLADLEKLAEQVEKAEKCLGQGNCKQAGEALDKAGEQIGQMEQRGQDAREAGEKLAQIREVKQSLARGAERRDGKSPRPGGRRPETKEGESASQVSRVRGPQDARGQKEVVGYAEGGSFKKKSASEVAGEVRQAQQEAAEAIERQRIPKAASDSAKGYFDNLGGQKP